MANTNNDVIAVNPNPKPTVEIISPLVVDDLAQDALRTLARQDTYKHLSASELADMLFKKAIRGAVNAEFESKPASQFKTAQAVNRKTATESKATLGDYKVKLFGIELAPKYAELVANLKGYGDKLK